MGDRFALSTKNGIDSAQRTGCCNRLLGGFPFARFFIFDLPIPCHYKECKTFRCQALGFSLFQILGRMRTFALVGLPTHCLDHCKKCKTFRCQALGFSLFQILGRMRRFQADMLPCLASFLIG